MMQNRLQQHEKFLYAEEDGPDQPSQSDHCLFSLLNIIIICLSLLTMTNLSHMREMLLFACSKMAD